MKRNETSTEITINKKEYKDRKRNINDIFRTFHSNINNIKSSDLMQMNKAKNQILNQRNIINKNMRKIETKKIINPINNMLSDKYYNSIKGKYSIINEEKKKKSNKISEKYKRSFINPNSSKYSFLNQLSSRNMALKSSQQTQDSKIILNKVLK